MNRVVITGAGTINPLATDLTGTFEAFANGMIAIGPLEIAEVNRLTVKIGAQIKDWQPEAHFEPGLLAILDPFSQYALFAARQAVSQSGLNLNLDRPETGAVVLGTAGGGLTTSDDNFRAVYQTARNRVHPFVVPRLMHNAAASHLSMAFQLRGPCLTMSNACASANTAMGLALQMVRSGATTVCLTGGSDAMLTFGGMKAWEGLRVMSPDGCRPFSLNRNGMVQGEGAAVFVFEEFEHARRRGADILAEVAGFGTTSGTVDLVQPSAEAAARAIACALADAGISADEVGYVNAHGTATRANDLAETTALRMVFGEQLGRIPVSSTKSMHGHLMGGSGAVELLACLQALRTGVIAPTMGYDVADPDCVLDVVPNEARLARVSVAVSNSFAFGGTNAVLVLRKV